MDITFRKLTLQDKPLIESCLKNQEHLGWEYSFAMIWTWDVFDETCIYADADCILLYNVFFGKMTFFPPFVYRPECFAAAVDKIAAYCRTKGVPMVIKGLTPAQVAMLSPDKYKCTAERDNFDYIYTAQDLISLAGKKFHAKRNYVTRFEAAYSFSVKEYTPDQTPQFLELYDRWHVKSVHETLDLERKAILRALTYCRELDLKILYIECEGKVVAFSVSSVKGNKVAHTLFEKGDINYVGVYQAINKYTAQKYFADVELVNRQEDMGIEGLRKVKLSYNPVLLLEKHRVEIC